MKAKLVRNVKKLAAVATGALFVGATLGMASVFASGLSSLPGLWLFYLVGIRLCLLSTLIPWIYQVLCKKVDILDQKSDGTKL